jgi:hypothetical protein
MHRYWAACHAYMPAAAWWRCGHGSVCLWCHLLSPCSQASIDKHFPGALGVDDFMSRLEVALGGFGEHACLWRGD